MMTGFLTNEDIKRLYASGQAPIRHPVHGAQTTCDHLHLRPAKIDLRVGQIQTPNALKAPPKKYHTLRAGEVAYVEVLEDICLPDDMMGLMFPKSGEVAQQGILITNVGHVDAGYHGKLTYTVINLSAESYELRRDDALAYLMLYQFESAPKPAWSPVGGSSGGLAEMVERGIKTDFMDLTQRMTTLAESVADRRLSATMTPSLMIALVALLASFAGGWFFLSTPKQQELELKLARLEARLDGATLDERVKTLEARVPAVAPPKRTEAPL
jgi:dUTPase